MESKKHARKPIRCDYSYTVRGLHEIFHTCHDMLTILVTRALRTLVLATSNFIPVRLV